MSHECEDCGEAFETLTRLRLHDCPGYDTAPVREFIDEVDQGDPVAVRQAIDEFESALESAAGSSGSQYRDVFWEGYEPLANQLDTAVQTEGWPFLVDLIKDLDPNRTGDVPFSSPVIENAVGRLFIRTRLTEGVEAIPVDGLEYLSGIPRRTESGVDWEESFAYGWGVGHPDYTFSDHISEAIHDHMFWVESVLEHAFYADQRTALDLLTDLLRDDSIELSVRHPSGEVDESRFLLSSVSGLNTERWPQIPRYWEWQEEFGYSFEWESEVEQQLSDLVSETGVEGDLPDEWTFQDLAL